MLGGFGASGLRGLTSTVCVCVCGLVTVSHPRVRLAGCFCSPPQRFLRSYGTIAGLSALRGLRLFCSSSQRRAAKPACEWSHVWREVWVREANSKPFCGSVPVLWGHLCPPVTAVMTSSPRVLPYLSFSQPRCLLLIGAAWSHDPALHFPPSHRQLRLCCVSLLDGRSFCVCICECVWQQRRQTCTVGGASERARERALEAKCGES